MAYPTSLGNPNIPSLKGYPGFQGFRSALNAYFDQAAGQEQNAQEQLAGASAADPLAQNYQANTGGFGGYGGAGRGQEAATGTYAQLMGPSDVAGVGAGDTARIQALQNVGNTELSAAKNVYSQQMANMKDKAAHDQQGFDLLKIVEGIPADLASFDKGAKYINGLTGGDSLSGIKGLYSNWFGKGATGMGAGAGATVGESGAPLALGDPVAGFTSGAGLTDLGSAGAGIEGLTGAGAGTDASVGLGTGADAAATGTAGSSLWSYIMNLL